MWPKNMGPLARGDGRTTAIAGGSEEVVGEVGMRSGIKDKERHLALHDKPTEMLSNVIPADAP